MRLKSRFVCLGALLHFGCARSSAEGTQSRVVVSSDPSASSSALSSSTVASSAREASSIIVAVAEASSARPPPALAEVRELRFSFRPSGARPSEYEMTDPLDQHQILLMPGVQRGNPKAVIALHGQPRRGQSPRDYAFPRIVAETVLQLVAAREVEPLVLLIPRFRFEGYNWPAFALDGFMARANAVLADEGIVLSHPYVFGHSGAAGCGGAGLNRALPVEPSAVGFFDTCLGPGFVESAAELASHRIPVLIIHSVETAGFRPRQRTEYLSSFDFGRVYRPLGLLPIPCPSSVPDVPLRESEYRCAGNPSGTTRAFVVDTGEGELAHNAVVPVGLRYFLKEYVERR